MRKFTDSDRQVVAGFGSLHDYNESLDTENKIKIVSYEDFIKLNKDKEKYKSQIDKFICSINNLEVVQETDNVEFIIYINNNEYHANTNRPSFMKYGEHNFNRVRYTKVLEGRPTEINSLCENSRLLTEKIIAICCSIILDELPDTFSKYSLQANVKDLSGNSNTANKYKIKPFKFDIDNIEWTNTSRNVAHSNLLQKIYKYKNDGINIKMSANNIQYYGDVAATHGFDKLLDLLK